VGDPVVAAGEAMPDERGELVVGERRVLAHGHRQAPRPGAIASTVNAWNRAV
jgi:hypothetical protein